MVKNKFNTKDLSKLVNGPHFQARTQPEPDIFSEARFRPKSEIYRVVKQAHNRWGAFSPPKISIHCIAILTFAETFKEYR